MHHDRDDLDDEDFDLEPDRDRSGRVFPKRKKPKPPAPGPDLHADPDDYRARLLARGITPAEAEAAALAMKSLRTKEGIIGT